MIKEIVAADIDDVFVGTAQMVISHINKVHGASMSINKYYTRDPSDWNAPDADTAAERINNFMESEEFYELPPVQEAIDVLRGLKKVHALYVVTGRPDIAELATRQWLETHLPDIFEDVVFTNYFDAEKVRTKGEVCRAIGATVLIDDHLDHCISALGQGVKPLLFGNYPWNRRNEVPEGIIRVEGWADVYRLLLPDETS